jgi:outer membrane lipoprotein-sorting protein
VGSQDGTISGGTRESRIEISQEAALLLKEMISAYQDLNMAELDGTIWARFEMEDGEKEFSQKFNSAFHQPNQFKHVLQQDLLIGSSGEKIFMFQKSANTFFETNMPKVSPGSLPPPLPQLLQAQNPSLLMALARNPLTPLGLEIAQISRVDDVVAGGLTCPTLSIKPADADYKVLLLLDPETKLLKGLRVDIQAGHLQPGSDLGFKSVLTEVTYTTIQTSPGFEPSFFDWTPPEGSERMASLQDEEILKK